MTAAGMQKLLALLRQLEGLCLTAYQDTVGVWTIGYGHNLQAHGYTAADAAKQVWTREQSETALQLDASQALNDVLSHWSWAKDLDDVRQAVLVDMVFQMGVGKVSRFVDTLPAIESGHYANASTLILKSTWAHQTHQRCATLSAMMSTGEWPDGLA